MDYEEDYKIHATKLKKYQTQLKELEKNLAKYENSDSLNFKESRYSNKSNPITNDLFINSMIDIKVQQIKEQEKIIEEDKRKDELLNASILERPYLQIGLNKGYLVPIDGLKDKYKFANSARSTYNLFKHEVLDKKELFPNPQAIHDQEIILKRANIKEKEKYKKDWIPYSKLTLERYPSNDN